MGILKLVLEILGITSARGSSGSSRKQELAEDVREMKGVYARSEKDTIWKDLDPFIETPDEKKKLVNQIKGQVSSGISTVAAQPMDELAG